ncbi:MAG: DUF975 family protein [Clostridia bacterium]|nr:DUF975 family protein [Clostridia bacterium]
MFFSALWKRQAREALRHHWLTGLLIALVVNLPALLVQGIAAATGNDLMTRVTDLLYASLNAGGTAVDQERLAAGLAALRDASGVWVMQGLSFAAWLLTPCLTIGMLHWLQMLLRKQAAGDVTAVFSRMGTFFKGIGLWLYTALRVFLWMLPGLALNVAAMLPLWLSDASSRISVLSAANTTVGLQAAAMGITAALAVMAMLKYALGAQILADHPEKGPVEAARESNRMTRGKKGMLFSLYLSFLIWYLLEITLVSVMMDMMGPVIAMMAEMLCSLAISVYLNGALTGFYLTALRSESAAQPEGEAETE